MRRYAAASPAAAAAAAAAAAPMSIAVAMDAPIGGASGGDMALALVPGVVPDAGLALVPKKAGSLVVAAVALTPACQVALALG